MELYTGGQVNWTLRFKRSTNSAQAAFESHRTEAPVLVRSFKKTCKPRSQVISLMNLEAELQVALCWANVAVKDDALHTISQRTKGKTKLWQLFLEM